MIAQQNTYKSLRFMQHRLGPPVNDPTPGERPLDAAFRQAAMRALRADAPPRALPADVCDIYFEEVRLTDPADPVHGAYLMPLVTLRTAACKWARASGCLMCGYHLGALDRRATEAELLAQTEDAIRRLDPRVYPALVFTSNGSFLDPGEVHDGLRPRLVARLRDAGFRFLVTETRPEYVTRARVMAMAEAFAPDADPARRPLSFSFGLESADDIILSQCINKGTTVADISAAWDVVGEAGCSIDAYVLLGKPFLTAREDVDDAVRTIRYAIDRGVGYVFLMMTNRTRFSLVDHLIRTGRQRLPSLWRAFEVLDRLPEADRRHVQVKAISHAPYPPDAYATTCPVCVDAVRAALNHWNQTGDAQHLTSVPDCACRADFRLGEWTETAPPLTDRLAEARRHLSRDLGLGDATADTACPLAKTGSDPWR
jgi:radical SAM enzyme (TIGR01210 family)